MQIIIDIDDNLYTRLFDNGVDNYDAIELATMIRNGTPLPKGRTMLFIDIPETCADCPCCIYSAIEKSIIGYCNTSDNDYYCKLLDRFMEYDKVEGGIAILGKPLDCPLEAYKEKNNADSN